MVQSVISQSMRRKCKSIGRARLKNKGVAQKIRTKQAIDDDELLHASNKIVKLGKRLGAQEIEVFMMRSRGTDIDIEKDKITFANTDVEFGIGIRVIKNKRLGFSYCTDLQKAEAAIRHAISLSNLSKEVDCIFPESPSKLPRVKYLYDRRITQLTVRTAVKYANMLIEAAKSVARSITVVGGGLAYGEDLILLANSNGLEIMDRSTGITVGASTIMKGRIPSTGFDTETSRLRNIDYEAVGRNAGELAKLTANPKKFGKSVELEVIFRPYALASLLEYITAPSLYGESAYKGESVYAGKLDELVASENLTIADNQVLPNGINSGIIDDEGIPARRVDLIKNGMLTSYLFDLYTGAEYGEQSTGNATRSERWASGKSYKSPPSVKAKNIVIEARRNDYKPMEKLQAEMEHGIIVHDILGAHTSNPASGDFSVSSTILFEVKRGEIISPLKTVMLSGNFHKLLNNITGFGNDFKRVAGGFSQVSAYVPSVRFEQVMVIG